jgi:ABC-type bacteriocin/lantibiotic exporter with double-glycine peptidase domain
MINYRTILRYILPGNIKYLLVTLFIGSSLSLLSGYTLILTKHLVDEFVEISLISDIIPLLFLILSVKISQVIVQHLNMYFEYLLSNKMTYKINNFFLDFINPQTITNIETPKFRNEIGYLRNAINIFSRLIPSLSTILNQFFLLSAYLTVIFTYNKYIILLFMITILPMFIFEKKISKRAEKFRLNRIRKKRFYYTD